MSAINILFMLSLLTATKWARVMVLGSGGWGLILNHKSVEVYQIK